MDDELQIPEHGFDNEGAVSHTKSLKDPSKYILQSCHDNDNYTNEVLKLLHGESNQTKFSKTSAMDFSSNYVICQDETQAMMNGKCMRSETMSSCRALTLKSVRTSIFKILKRVMNSVALKYISSQVIDKLVLMEKNHHHHHRVCLCSSRSVKLFPLGGQLVLQDFEISCDSVVT